MKDLRWSCRQERIALIEWYLGFRCFIMGMLFDDHLYISTFVSGAVCVCVCVYSKALKFNSACVNWQSQQEWFFSLHSYHAGVHQIWATRTNVTIDCFVLFDVNRKWKGPAALFGHSRSLTAACEGGKLAFSSFPPLREEENGKCSFTADEGGGRGATAGLPPLRVEEYLKMRVYRPCKQRWSRVSVRMKPQGLSISNWHKIKWKIRYFRFFS